MRFSGRVSVLDRESGLVSDPVLGRFWIRLRIWVGVRVGFDIIGRFQLLLPSLFRTYS